MTSSNEKGHELTNASSDARDCIFELLLRQGALGVTDSEESAIHPFHLHGLTDTHHLLVLL